MGVESVENEENSSGSRKKNTLLEKLSKQYEEK